MTQGHGARRAGRWATERRGSAGPYGADELVAALGLRPAVQGPDGGHPVPRRGR
ncbi:hypothetical protein H0H10_01100 [Streptomyces sp. TRM S81-3]|uniref:Uncharacterized protein n=1 Tax=Streptomyces griseicoloratus TaxID=2752516 RepID=A0A926KXU7_9ACTN|nr:hypothetical protein [Streptomyces griseicoloratus]